MEKFIEKIKNKPPHQQQRMILFIMLGVLIALLVIWAIIGIPARVNPNSQDDLINKVNEGYNSSKNIMPDLFPKN